MCALPTARHAGDAALRHEVDRLAADNDRLTVRFLAEEQRSSELMKCVLALRRLHEAPDRPQLIDAFEDVIVNVLGSEQMAVLTRDGADAPFVVARALGDAARRLQPLTLSAGSTDELMAMLGAAASETADHELLACVPLLCGSRVAGAVVVFALLEHKYGFEPADLELLELLSVHGGSALAATAACMAPGNA